MDALPSAIAPARRRAPRRPAAERRDELIEAAVRVFARQPFGAASTAEVAAEAGVAEPTLFRQFASKRELYRAAVERVTGRIASELNRRASGRGDAPAALQAMTSWYRETAEAAPADLRLRFRALSEADDEAVRGLVQRCQRDILTIFRFVFERGRRDGTFRAGLDPAAAAMLVAGWANLVDVTLVANLDDRAMRDYFRAFEELVDAVTGPRRRSSRHSTAASHVNGP